MIALRVLRFVGFCPFTFVASNPHPRRYWWDVISVALLIFSGGFARLGMLARHNVLLFPTSDGAFLS